MTFLLMTIVVALRVMAQNRMRSLLTMLGIIIGVGSLIVMVSIGEGAKAALAVYKYLQARGLTKRGVNVDWGVKVPTRSLRSSKHKEK